MIKRISMFVFHKDKKAVCDEFGNKIFIELGWSIDKELSALFEFDDATWNIVAIQKRVADPCGRIRLGWEVVAIASTAKSPEITVPKDEIAKALKAFGYGDGRGHDDNVPVYFNLQTNNRNLR
jgi:hypothetical protein